MNEEVALRTVNARRESEWRRTLAIAPEIDLCPVAGPAFDLTDYEDAFAAEADRVVVHP